MPNVFVVGRVSDNKILDYKSLRELSTPKWIDLSQLTGHVEESHSLAALAELDISDLVQDGHGSVECFEVYELEPVVRFRIVKIVR